MLTEILALPAPTAPTGPGGDTGGNWTGFLLPVLLLFAVLIFMPLFSKKERTRQKRLQTVKKHDRVVTTGGLFGTVVAIDEHTATLEVAKGVRMTFKRSAIHDLERPAEGPAAEAPDKQPGTKGA